MRQIFALAVLFFVITGGVAQHVHAAPFQCQKTWFELSLPENIKQCRVFGVKKPSTMTFFASAPPEKVIEFFTSAGNATQSRFLNDFTHIKFSHPDFHIYVYADGPGTQVNIRAEP